MRDERRGVLDLARAAVDRRHPESYALASLEAICEDAVVRVGRVVEQRDITPQNQLSGRVGSA